ncbi:MAG: hypothetical protein GY928_33575 [Colwellia sp.]|nr:hypothetical protein [Colwellia sp.]
MKDLIEHRPNPKTNVTFGEGKDKVEYKCDARGKLMLPIRIENLNPVEEEEIKPKKKKKVKED